MQVREQVNGGVKHLVIMPVAWMENLSSTGYILNAEWCKEHGIRASFVEDMVKSHRVGLGK